MGVYLDRADGRRSSCQGSIGAALGGSLLASVASGAAFFVAPSALVSTGIGIGWAVLKVSLFPNTDAQTPFSLIPPSPVTLAKKKKFAYNHRPASLIAIQSRISSLLHLAPPASTAPVPAASQTAPRPTRSFFASAGERAERGSDARADERADSGERA